MCTVLYPNRVLDSPAGRLQWPSVETMTWSGVIGITHWDCSPKSVAAFCRFRRERLAVKPVWLLFISYLLQSFDCILWAVGIWSPNGHCLSPSNGEVVLRIWLTRFSLSSGWTSRKLTVSLPSQQWWKSGQDSFLVRADLSQASFATNIELSLQQLAVDCQAIVKKITTSKSDVNVPNWKA